MFSLLSAVPGKTYWALLKYGALVLAVLAILGAVFWAGHRVGENAGIVATTEKYGPKVEALQLDLQKVRNEYADAKVAWAQARAAAAALAATELEASVQKAKAIEASAQAKIATINRNWISYVARIENEQTEALQRVRFPVLSANPLDDGMWVDVTSCEDRTGTGANPSGMSAAGNSDANGPYRCRLHPQVAERLVESAAQANKVVADYNACSASLKVLSPQSFPEEH